MLPDGPHLKGKSIHCPLLNCMTALFLLFFANLGCCQTSLIALFWIISNVYPPRFTWDQAGQALGKAIFLRKLTGRTESPGQGCLCFGNPGFAGWGTPEHTSLSWGGQLVWCLLLLAASLYFREPGPQGPCPEAAFGLVSFTF